MTTVSAGEGPLGRLVSFIRSDHRYVLLGTSAIAAAGYGIVRLAPSLFELHDPCICA